jgi:hypothetical protein
MSATEHLTSSSYFTIHRWLVNHTRAYQRLFSDIADRLKKSDFPHTKPGLLVPSSTGDLLVWVEDVADTWWCVDSDPRCLKNCSHLLSDVQTRSADLNREWPFKKSEFGLTVSVHGLHYLEHPGSLLDRVYGSLAPGGLSVWVVFQGEGTHHPSLIDTITRIGKTHGLSEAADILTWKVLDSLMLALSGRDHHFWSHESLKALLSQHGYTVESIRPTFDGCSWLALAGKERETV